MHAPHSPGQERGGQQPAGNWRRRCLPVKSSTRPAPTAQRWGRLNKRRVRNRPGNIGSHSVSPLSSSVAATAASKGISSMRSMATAVASNEPSPIGVGPSVVAIAAIRKLVKAVENGAGEPRAASTTQNVAASARNTRLFSTAITTSHTQPASRAAENK